MKNAMRPGYVMDPRKGKVIPFLSWRRISRGRHKDMIEIEYPNPTPRAKRFRVHKSAIRRWPGKEAPR